MDGFFMHARNLLERTASDKRLTAADRQVLDCAMLNTRTPGDAVALGIDYLVQGTGLARSSVIRSRQNLVRLGYLISCGYGQRGLLCYHIATGSVDATPGRVDATGRTDATGSVGATGTGSVGATGTGSVDATQIDTGNMETTTYAQNDEKLPSSSAPETPSEESNQQGELEPIPSPQGNQTPSLSLPRTANDAGVRKSPAKVAWDGARIIVPDVFMESWSESFPHVDLRAAIKKASSWCLANPGKRPKKDFSRFLHGWFSRVKPGDRDYIDPEEQAADDADLIRQAEEAFPDPVERAGFFWQRQRQGLRIPPGVECKPTAEDLTRAARGDKEVAV